jgi:hypothetical protein
MAENKNLVGVEKVLSRGGSGSRSTGSSRNVFAAAGSPGASRVPEPGVT